MNEIPIQILTRYDDTRTEADYEAEYGLSGIYFDEYDRNLPFKTHFPYFQYCRGQGSASNGTDTGYIEFNNIVLDPNRDFTFDFWFNKWKNGYNRLFDFNITTNNFLYAFCTNGHFCVNNSDNTKNVSLGSGIWHHCALCYDSTAHTLSFFLNGNLEWQATNYSMPSYNPLPALWIGKSSYPQDPVLTAHIQLIRISYKCLFKENFNCHNINALKYIGPYLINNFSTPTLAS